MSFIAQGQSAMLSCLYMAIQIFLGTSWRYGANASTTLGNEVEDEGAQRRGEQREAIWLKEHIESMKH
jgi:hypothetical protein